MNRRRIIQKQQQHRKQAPSTGSSRLHWYILGGLVVVALLAAGAFFLLNRPAASQPESGFVYPEKIGTTVGEQDAPVFILIFSDFRCPYCRLFSETVQRQIIDEYVATGKVRMEYRHLIVIDRNTGTKESNRAAQASECASEQRHFWPYHDLLFASQQGESAGAFSDEKLSGFAAELGLDTEKFETCLSSNRYANKIRVDGVFAQQQNATSTPAVFIAGKRVNDPNNWEMVKAAIDTALAENTK